MIRGIGFEQGTIWLDHPFMGGEPSVRLDGPHHFQAYGRWQVDTASFRYVDTEHLL
jgi:hypothetical protein